jgi:hypothetical protein
MFVTMREYLKAKGVEIDDLPIVNKSAESFHEHVIFKGGIMAKIMRGRHVGKNQVWITPEVKQVNKTLGFGIFNNDSMKNIIQEPNNCNVILYEKFGDVSVMWTVPVNDKIITHMAKGLTSAWESSQFVGYTIIMYLRKHGLVSALKLINKFPKMTSLQHTEQEFRDRLQEDFGHIETALNTDFLRQLFKEIDFHLIGYDETTLFGINLKEELISLHFYMDPNVEKVREKLSLTAGRLIDDCTSTRIQNQP